MLSSQGVSFSKLPSTSGQKKQNQLQIKHQHIGNGNYNIFADS